MTNLAEKYIVRKIIGPNPVVSDELTESKPLPQGTYFVLLKQDLLAVQALWSYIGVLHVACEIMEDGPEKAELAILADKISDLAFGWEETSPKKLPD